MGRVWFKNKANAHLFLTRKATSDASLTLSTYEHGSRAAWLCFLTHDSTIRVLSALEHILLVHHEGGKGDEDEDDHRMIVRVITDPAERRLELPSGLP